MDKWLKNKLNFELNWILNSPLKLRSVFNFLNFWKCGKDRILKINRCGPRFSGCACPMFLSVPLVNTQFLLTLFLFTLFGLVSYVLDFYTPLIPCTFSLDVSLCHCSSILAPASDSSPAQLARCSCVVVHSGKAEGDCLQDLLTFGSLIFSHRVNSRFLIFSCGKCDQKRVLDW
jgi:hypothetical protein